jgi:hypothetical protein
MASIKQTRSGSYQLCVKNKLLPKTLWATFDTYELAQQYGTQLERLLAQGIVPASLLEQEPPKRTAWTIARCITEYIRHNAVPLSDIKLLDTVRPALGLLSTSNLNYNWADAWVTSMKREGNLAPSIHPPSSRRAGAFFMAELVALDELVTAGGKTEDNGLRCGCVSFPASRPGS